MKVKFHFLLIFFSLISLSLFAQTTPALTDSTWLGGQSWEKDVKTTRKMLAFEEFMKSFPEGEGELTYYLQGDSIRKINEWSSTEQVIIIRDFYYKDTLLAAVHVREFKYPTTGGVVDHRHANKLSDYVVVFDLAKGTTQNKIIMVSKKGYGTKEEYLKSSALYRMVFILAQ